MSLGFARWCRGTVFVALGACSLWATSAEQRSFAPLDVSPRAGEAYVIGREADLSATPTWADLEAETLKLTTLRRGSFQGADNTKIHYRLYQHRSERKGAVIVLSGRTEGLVLYQEVILDLVRNGYSVYIHDHRGQGFSERLVGSDPTLGYIDDFTHYVKDLATFVDGPVRSARAAGAGPMYLLAHSMGGTIAALYLEGPHAPDIRAAALITPMMEPWAAGGDKPGVVAKAVDAYCDRHGGEAGFAVPWLSKAYAQGEPFEGQYQKYRQNPDASPNGASHSRLRFARNWEARRTATCTGADCGSPNAQVGGTSFRWLNLSCGASQQARGEAAAKIDVPVLLLQGGQDIKVKPAASAEFCTRLNQRTGPGYCVGRTMVGAEHAVLIESDEFRVPAIASVLRFFDCSASGKARCD